MQKGYDEKLSAYEVCDFDLRRCALPITDALVKDSKKFEKEEVGLQEKKKHLLIKQKKFKKSIQEVCLPKQDELEKSYSSQDGHSKSESLATISNCASELETNRAKLGNLEEKLAQEEAELEEIRDSLKGK